MKEEKQKSDGNENRTNFIQLVARSLTINRSAKILRFGELQKYLETQ